MAKLSSVYERFTFCYMYKDDSELYLIRYHYYSYDDAFEALEEFLRSCAVDGDTVVFSKVLSFTLNVVFDDSDIIKVCVMNTDKLLIDAAHLNFLIESRQDPLGKTSFVVRFSDKKIRFRSMESVLDFCDYE